MVWSLLYRGPLGYPMVCQTQPSVLSLAGCGFRHCTSAAGMASGPR